MMFGSGLKNKADPIEVDWPSGQVEQLPNIASGQIITVRETKGQIAARAYIAGNSGVPWAEFRGPSLVSDLNSKWFDIGVYAPILRINKLHSGFGSGAGPSFEIGRSVLNCLESISRLSRSVQRKSVMAIADDSP